MANGSDSLYEHGDGERKERAPSRCLPLIDDAKPKQGRRERLQTLAGGTPLPSALAAGVLHMSRRFLLGWTRPTPWNVSPSGDWGTHRRAFERFVLP
jgi:hypothetical protein